MSKRKADLPIMLGKNLRKGIVAYRNDKMGGYDLAVLWLKREYPTGAEYSMDDVDKLDAVLHFCDRSSIIETIAELQWMLDQWKEREGGRHMSV